MGKVTSIQEDIVTIETDVGTLRTTTEMVKDEIDLRLLLIVLALTGVIGSVLILRGARKLLYTRKLDEHI